jgi:Protein of unknown function (DUF1569)
LIVVARENGDRMAATLWDEKDRRAILGRIERLTPDATPRWGRMDASCMVVHVTDALRMATGELRCTASSGPLTLPIVKHLVMFYLPWPKGVPTAPELLVRRPDRWPYEIAALRAAIEEFVTKSQGGAWPRHPRFGHLTGPEWGRFMYRHLNHHLTQFGL